MSFKNPHTALYIAGNLVLVLLGFLVVLLSPVESPVLQSVLSGVGASTVATGIAGLWMGLLVRKDHALIAATRLVGEMGLIQGFSGRSVSIRDEYTSRLAKARRRIDIMGFGLSSLRQDMAKDFPVWKEQARVRILLVDPEFPNRTTNFASQRDQEEGTEAGTIKRQVREFAQACAPVIEEGRFEVRLYRCLPALNIFRIDDEVFFGPYLIRAVSRNMPTLLARRGGTLFETLVADHFEKIWSDPILSREVPVEWFQP